MNPEDRRSLDWKISRVGAWLGNLNDRLYGRRPERWGRRSWRFVDRIAGRLYCWGER